MIKYFNLLTAVLICSMAVLSCTDEVRGSIVYKGQKQLSFAGEGGVQAVTFETPESWTASVTNTGTTEGQEWAELDRTSGDSGENTLEITVKPNDGDKENTAALTVFCGDDVLVVSIVQSAVGQGGGDIGPDEPGHDSGSMISREKIGSDEILFEFEY